MLNNYNKVNLHPYHLVDPSPWPMFISASLLVLMLGLVLYFHSYRFGFLIFLFGLVFVCFSLIVWWRDIIREATFRGLHTIKVSSGLRIGMALFIVSEIMFFFSFFWAFFHSSLSPSIEIGCVWPPKGLNVLDPFAVPMLNTVILLTSGATVTFAHYCLQLENRINCIYGFVITIVLAIIFTMFQVYEYLNASFSISDGIYGTTFFLSTGFHGLHVIIGTIFLTVCFSRFLLYHFTPRHHLGFEFAAWYWHFVDVVWLFLFLFIYVWGSV
jgi:heme/copper-type cytochrome/quinol oxidase subunit 3